jgi:hypothetical protein
MAKHATVKIGDYEIPLIGIEECHGLETCDCCGYEYGFDKIFFTGRGFLCFKCKD